MKIYIVSTDVVIMLLVSDECYVTCGHNIMTVDMTLSTEYQLCHMINRFMERESLTCESKG